MWSRARKKSDDSVRVRYPHPGQRFVDARELLESTKARELIERMADLARNNAVRRKETSDPRGTAR